MNKTWISFAAAVLVLSATSADAGAQQQIPVGSPLALTGPYAFYGVAVRRGIEVGIDEINNNGGVNGTQIKWIVDDDAGLGSQTITIANRMITRDNVVAIVGPSTTIETLSIAPLVNDKQVPMVGNSPAPDVRKAGKWSFNLQEPPASSLGRLAQYAIDALKVKRVAMVYPSENEGFIVQKNLLRDYWKSKGIEIVSDNAVSASESDFAALGTKLADEHLDAISVYLPPEQSGNMVVQARRAGVLPSVPIIGPSSLASQSYIDSAGKAAEGTVLLADFLASNKSEISQHFVAMYTKKFGTVPDNWAAVGYTAAQIVGVALRKGGTDRAKVRDAIEQIKGMPSVLGAGSYSFGGGRVPQYGGTITTVKGGKFVAVQ